MNTLKFIWHILSVMCVKYVCMRSSNIELTSFALDIQISKFSGNGRLLQFMPLRKLAASTIKSFTTGDSWAKCPSYFQLLYHTNYLDISPKF